MASWLTRVRRYVGCLLDLPYAVRGTSAQLHFLNQKVNRIMALAEEIRALLAKIDAATNAVAERIAQLKAQIKNSLTDAEVADIQSQLTAAEARLRAVAADPDNPVPPAPTPE